MNRSNVALWSSFFFLVSFLGYIFWYFFGFLFEILFGSLFSFGVLDEIMFKEIEDGILQRKIENETE